MIGRKRTIFYGSLVSLFGSALQTGANTMAMLIAGRFIGGMAVGMLTSKQCHDGCLPNVG
jgi:MFS family permease